MKKFPVTSKEGNEYLIKITDDGYGFLKGKIYKKVKLPGVKLHITVKLNWMNNWLFGKESWEFDYIKIAKRCVEKYEDSVTDKLRNKKLHKQNKDKFIDWDGKC